MNSFNPNSPPSLLLHVSILQLIYLMQCINIVIPMFTKEIKRHPEWKVKQASLHPTVREQMNTMQPVHSVEEHAAVKNRALNYVAMSGKAKV